MKIKSRFQVEEPTAGNHNFPLDDRVIVTVMADVRRPENKRETITKIGVFRVHKWM
jgi:hypothetical protein